MEHRVQTTCLVILTVIALGAALMWLRPVMIPFVVAIFITIGLEPLMDLQTKRLRLPRLLALATTLVLALLAAMGIGSLVSASVAQLSQNAASYAAQATALADRISNTVLPSLPAWLGIDAATDQALSNLLSGRFLAPLLVSTTNAIVDLLSKGLLVFVFVCFLLGGTAERPRATGIWGLSISRVERFLLTKALVSAATGALVGLTLSLLEIDLALMFALLAFLLNFIPNLGSIVATVLPLPVVLMTPDVSSTTAILAIGIPGAIQLTIGNFLEPKIMGSSLDLHPVSILLSLIVWGMLWGIVGMFLATPLTAVIKILLEHFEGSRPVAELLAGRVDALRSVGVAAGGD